MISVLAHRDIRLHRKTGCYQGIADIARAAFYKKWIYEYTPGENRCPSRRLFRAWVGSHPPQEKGAAWLDRAHFFINSFSKWIKESLACLTLPCPAMPRRTKPCPTVP